MSIFINLNEDEVKSHIDNYMKIIFLCAKSVIHRVLYVLHGGKVITVTVLCFMLLWAYYVACYVSVSVTPS